jgi:hypothetical protein
LCAESRVSDELCVKTCETAVRGDASVSLPPHYTRCAHRDKHNRHANGNNEEEIPRRGEESSRTKERNAHQDTHTQQERKNIRGGGVYGTQSRGPSAPPSKVLNVRADTQTQHNTAPAATAGGRVHDAVPCHVGSRGCVHTLPHHCRGRACRAVRRRRYVGLTGCRAPVQGHHWGTWHQLLEPRWTSRQRRGSS